MPQSWKIGFTDTKSRLDVFLTTKIEGLSRAQAKKRVEAGDFLVNDKLVSGHHFLKEGDVVSAATASSEQRVPKKTRPSQPVPIKEKKRTTLPALTIIRETPDWLVIEKPIGVVMHPDHDHAEGTTLIDAVVKHVPSMAKVGEDPNRPGIVSRLDKDVSGLVVIAKTQAAFDDLKRQFAEHTVGKEYIALVHGEMPKEEGDIKFRIARSTSKARMAASPANAEGGQAAWTHYDVVKRFTGATLVRLQILTGRTHQIRAHLHAFGHPVMGDPLYKLKQTKRNIDAPRVMLQSYKLAFNDPATQERVHFEQPIDPTFDHLMKQFNG